MNERDWQSFVDEADSVKQAMLLARVSNDASEKADRQNKRLWIALAGSIIGNVILAIVMVCSVIYMQAQINQLQLNAALCGVVRYPTATTYATTCNPFFGGYSCGCANGAY